MTPKRLMAAVLVLFLIGGCIMAKAQNNSYVVDTVDFTSNGWVVDDEVHQWSFVSASAPSFVVSVNADVTGYMSAGMKFRVSQSTDQLFFVSKVSSYVGGTTELTLFGGTNYELADDAITEVAYSRVQAPYGFSLDPEIWIIKLTDTSLRSRASPVADSWYQLDASHAITIPPGYWKIGYKTLANCGTVNNSMDIWTSLSTNISTPSDNEMTNSFSFFIGATGVSFYSASSAEKVISLDNETVYYLIIRSHYSPAFIYTRGDLNTTVIYAIWSGL